MSIVWKNHSVNLRNCCAAFCDSSCNRLFSSLNPRTSSSKDSLRRVSLESRPSSWDRCFCSSTIRRPLKHQWRTSDISITTNKIWLLCFPYCIIYYFPIVHSGFHIPNFQKKCSIIYMKLLLLVGQFPVTVTFNL